MKKLFYITSIVSLLLVTGCAGTYTYYPEPVYVYPHPVYVAPSPVIVVPFGHPHYGHYGHHR